MSVDSRRQEETTTVNFYIPILPAHGQACRSAGPNFATYHGSAPTVSAAAVTSSYRQYVSAGPCRCRCVTGRLFIPPFIRRLFIPLHSSPILLETQHCICHFAPSKYRCLEFGYCHRCGCDLATTSSSDFHRCSCAYCVARCCGTKLTASAQRSALKVHAYLRYC